jgi:hypothetical protein
VNEVALFFSNIPGALLPAVENDVFDGSTI